MKATIVHLEEEATSAKSFTFDISLATVAGQYLLVGMDGQEKPFGVVRPEPLTITVANIGPFTARLHALNKGDTIEVRGPFGNGFTPQGTRHLLVAGGYGVVPLYFLASELTKDKTNTVHVAIGAKTKNDILFVQKFEALGCAVHIATDDGSAGFHGNTVALCKKLFAVESVDAVYTCGPLIMMQKLAELCQTHSIPCQASVDLASLPNASPDMLLESRGAVVEASVLLYGHE